MVLNPGNSIKLNEQEYYDVFKAYYGSLCSFACQYVEDPELAADIVQDGFAKLWQLRDDFYYRHQVKAFLYTMVRNRSLNELEHSKVAHEYEQKIKAKKSDTFFHDTVVEEETFRILSEAIEKLPPQMRSIMQLAWGERRTPKLPIPSKSLPKQYIRLRKTPIRNYANTSRITIIATSCFSCK